MNTTLVPSFPAPNKEELLSVMEDLKGVSEGFQVDIVDGQFVPAVSWPFNTESVSDALLSLKSYAGVYELEIDCMVNKPEQYLDIFIETGFKRVVLHYGSADNFEAAVNKLKENDIKVGLAITNNVSKEEILAELDKFDYIQVMGIKEVGEQGQSFDERTCQTVAWLRDKFTELEIAIDGSVNADTIPRLRHAGANRFAPGSAIVKAEDRVAAYKQLWSIATE